ncbi:prepilin peptidase [Xenophilus azovorans]|uniref:prepilin peptidase n=1 Tax=Xenophilus azovorans TaxID=151755 RepID=UPI000A075A10|nr:prepilin peptidase [Xenophilus azovorans]
MRHFFVLWLIGAIVFDWRLRRVPNWLVLAGALGAIGALAIHLVPLHIGWADALSACAATFVFLLLFYAAGLMGAADVKFAAALALWLGLEGMLWTWIGASLLAAVHSIGLMQMRRWTGAVRQRRREVPYAAHLATAALAWMAWASAAR